MKRILIIITMTILLVGCSTTKGLVEHSVEYRYIDRVSVDTFYTDRWHTIYTSGDTIYARDSIYVYKYKAMHDTLRLTDTLYKVKNVPYEVEKEPTFWERVGYLCKGGILAIAMVLVCVTFLRLRDKYKVKR